MYMEKKEEDLFNLDDFIDTPTEVSNNETTVETDNEKEPVTPEEPTTVETLRETTNPEKAKSIIPVKDEGEDEIAFNLRTQLAAAKLGRDEAETPEEKSFFQSKMDELRKGLTQNSEILSKDNQDGLDQDELEIVKRNLAQIGVKTEKEMEVLFDSKIAALRGASIAEEQTNALKTFYNSRKDIAANKDVRDFIENYVLSEYKVDINTKPAKLLEYFNNTAKVFFPEQSKDLLASKRAAEASSKMDVMSDTTGGGKVSMLDKDSSAFLKSQGWSDAEIDSWQL